MLIFSLPILNVPGFGADDRRTDIETAERVLSAQQDIAAVAKTAEERKEFEKLTRITTEDILDRPDDVGLNFRFAQQQMADEDILGAAATLERILMIHPDLHRVRLLYATVLYRLGDLQEAERELELLLQVEMPRTLRDDLEFQLDRIRQTRKLTHWTLRQNLGYGIDDNRNTAPSSKRQLSEDLPVDLTGTNRKRRDTNFLTTTNLQMDRDLGFQAGHSVYGSFTYLLQEQTMVDNLDLSSFRGEAGGTWKSVWVDLAPRFYMSHFFLSRESFLRSQGWALTARRIVRPRLTISSDFSIERQDYLNISENTSADDRTGPLTEVSLAAAYALTPKMRLNASTGFANKYAHAKENAYQSLNLTASHTWFLGYTQFLIHSVDVSFDYYRQADLAIAGLHRRDKSLRYRVTYGFSLDVLKLDKILPKPLEGITLTFTYEFYRSLSTITNYTYNNHKYQAMLGKTWGF